MHKWQIVFLLYLMPRAALGVDPTILSSFQDLSPKNSNEPADCSMILTNRLAQFNPSGVAPEPGTIADWMWVYSDALQTENILYGEAHSLYLKKSLLTREKDQKMIWDIDSRFYQIVFANAYRWFRNLPSGDGTELSFDAQSGRIRGLKFWSLGAFIKFVSDPMQISEFKKLQMDALKITFRGHQYSDIMSEFVSVPEAAAKLLAGIVTLSKASPLRHLTISAGLEVGARNEIVFEAQSDALMNGLFREPRILDDLRFLAIDNFPVQTRNLVHRLMLLGTQKKLRILEYDGIPLAI